MSLPGARAPYPGPVRTPLLGALALTLPVLPLLALGPAGPAGAADDQDARVVELRTVYTCEALGESGATEVFVRTQLPRTVTAGTKMAARPIDLTIVVPEEMVQTMRDVGVERVSGESHDATYRVGRITRDIRDLRLPTTEVPPPGELMVLEGQGTAQAVRLERVDTYPVKLPKAFTADVDVEGQFSTTVELACSLAEGERSKIGSVRVVR